ncbi:MAG: hypothetical protein M1548_00445 [Actinobacteria bacterium]|nr:hypothetical protein [Actinomycetota bacterium]
MVDDGIEKESLRNGGPGRAEREHLWRRARFVYLIVYLFLIAGILFSIAAIIRLLNRALS